MALVNKTWYYASLHPSLLKKELLTYYEKTTEVKGQPTHSFTTHELELFINMVLQTRRRLLNLKFCSLICLKDLSIFEQLGDNIVSLYLWDLYCLTDDLLDAVVKCRNLETLELKNISSISITVKSREPLLKLKRLDFNQVNPSDREFNQIILCAPNLKDIGFSDCILIEWIQAIQRFYPNYRNNEITEEYNSDDIFTPKNIVKHLKNLKHLNILRLNQCCDRFLQLLNILTLESLTLDLVSIASSNYSYLEKSIATHISLISLEVINWPYALLPAITKLYNLKHLKLILADFIVDENDTNHVINFTKSLSNLKSLEKLTIVPFVDHPFFPKVNIPDTILVSLKSLDCYIDSGIKLSNLGHNLTYLRIRNGNILTTEQYKLIFKNLTKLRYLRIGYCRNMNDDIMLGESSQDQNCLISNLKGLVSLTILGAKLSHTFLRSIKLQDLKHLNMNEMSVRDCIESKSFTEFDDTLKQLGFNVPALKNLQLGIRRDEYNLLGEQRVTIFESPSRVKIIKTYFRKLLNLLITNY
ncbi:uncharacterized protein LOC126835492 isoform X2 [Adelges cooleyi]|nr:uncharacterized protein LOC126835492 isoform X2 [Adelges cooleyi]